MNLVGIKKIVDGMELSPEATIRVGEILGVYSETDEIPTETIDKILKIVDIEMDTTQLAANVYRSGIELADTYLNKMDDEAGKIADEIDEKLKIGNNG